MFRRSRFGIRSRRPRLWGLWLRRRQGLKRQLRRPGSLWSRHSDGLAGICTFSPAEPVLERQTKTVGLVLFNRRDTTEIKWQMFPAPNRTFSSALAARSLSATFLGTKCAQGPTDVAMEPSQSTRIRMNASQKVAELGLKSMKSVTPNPSIEGMPKRLRLLCTPHVKR